MKRALQQTTKMGPREKVKDVKSSTASDSTTLPGETGQRKEIDPKGDVLLVLGAKSNEKTEILVSSKVLSLNSSVFSAMFSNSLSEGTALIQNSASNQPTRIPLPGDNCDAIILLCEILHFRYDHAKQGVPELAALLDLGIVVHKYDCSRALAFIGEKWMEKYLPSAGLNGFEDVLLIAYLFDDSKMFKAVSKKVVINHVGSFREAYAGCFNGIEEKLPVATFGFLEEQRAILQRVYPSTLRSMIDRRLAEARLSPRDKADRDCQTTVGKTLGDLLEIMLEGIVASSFALTLEGCRKLFTGQGDRPREKRCQATHSSEYISCTSIFTFIEDVLRNLENAEKALPGICLGCVKIDGQAGCEECGS